VIIHLLLKKLGVGISKKLLQMNRQMRYLSVIIILRAIMMTKKYIDKYKEHLKKGK